MPLKARITLLGVTCFVAGIAVIILARPFFRDLAASMFSHRTVCTDRYDFFGEEGWYPCTTPWSSSTQVLAVAGIVAGFVVVVLLVRAMAGRMLRPVRAMTDTVRELGPQNLGQRVGIRGASGELRRLAAALDDMLDRVATGYEGQRRFASNASHELRTPLAVQRTLVEVALVTGEQDMTRLAAQLLAVNERNEKLIEGLLVLAESDRGLPGVQPVRLDVLVGEVLDRFAEQATKHDVVLRRGLIERTVSGDRVLLERLVVNLVENAIKYNEPGGTVDVVVAGAPALAVWNTGQQVPAETVPALFEPFRRLTSERTYQRDGAGLGLSIVRSVVAAHHGSVSAEAGENGGLTVTVNLP